MKTPQHQEFGLFVTSNISLSHILFGDELFTPCGLDSGLNGHSNSEIRWYMPDQEFKLWVAQNRKSNDDGYRLCNKCLKAYDKLQFFLEKNEFMEDDRIFNAIVLLDHIAGPHYGSWVFHGRKKIETRMKNVIPPGDIVICCSNGGRSVNSGKALCIVTAAAGRPMTDNDVKLACIENAPGRIAFDLSNWRYFSRKFHFNRCIVSGTFQSIFQIRIPNDVKIVSELPENQRVAGVHLTQQQ